MSSPFKSSSSEQFIANQKPHPTKFILPSTVPKILGKENQHHNIIRDAESSSMIKTPTKAHQTFIIPSRDSLKRTLECVNVKSTSETSKIRKLTTPSNELNSQPNTVLTSSPEKSGRVKKENTPTITDTQQFVSRSEDEIQLVVELLRKDCKQTVVPLLFGKSKVFCYDCKENKTLEIMQPSDTPNIINYERVSTYLNRLGLGKSMALVDFSKNNLTDTKERDLADNFCQKGLFNESLKYNLYDLNEAGTIGLFIIAALDFDKIQTNSLEGTKCIKHERADNPAKMRLMNSKFAKSLSQKERETFILPLPKYEDIEKKGILNLFGKSYPLVGSVQFNERGDMDFKLDYDGSLGKCEGKKNKKYANSRLSRIMSTLELGKSMLFISFQEKDWLNKDRLESIKKYLNNIRPDPKSGCEYRFYGTSNSGLNSYTALFIDTRLNFDKIHNLLGDFSECSKYGSRKAFSRIAISLGTSFPSSVRLEEGEYHILDDKAYPCTDGIGFIQRSYFQNVLKNTKCSLLFDEKLVTIEVFFGCKFEKVVAIQCRVFGFKGVFVSIPDEFFKELLRKYEIPYSDSLKCVVRKSMVKFAGSPIYRNFDIINVSKPRDASINRTFMSCMLKRTSKKDEMQKIFEKQLDTFFSIDSKVTDRVFLHNSILSDFSYNHRSVHELVKYLVMGGFGMENPFVNRYVKKLFKTKYQSLVDKKLSLKMKVNFSRSFIGVIDESGTLKEDEVYIPGLDDNLKEVIIFRHPLAYEGDIIKLKLVHKKDIENNAFLRSMKNVIVFPKVLHGKSPHQYLGGGDLDGDEYQIIFHPELVNLFDDTETKLIDYDEGKTKPIANDENKLNSNDFITEHQNCFIQKHTYTGLLFYYNTIARESNSKSDLDLKIKLAKAYSHSIDSIKNVNIDFDQLIREAKSRFKCPAWYSTCSNSLKISSSTREDITGNGFERTMLLKIIKGYKETKAKFKSLLEEVNIEDSFSEYENETKEWETDFKKAYDLWNQYWKNLKCDETKSTHDWIALFHGETKQKHLTVLVKISH